MKKVVLRIADYLLWLMLSLAGAFSIKSMRGNMMMTEEQELKIYGGYTQKEQGVNQIMIWGITAISALMLFLNLADWLKITLAIGVFIFTTLIMYAMNTRIKKRMKD